MEHCPYNTDCSGCVTYADNLLDIEHVSLSYGNKIVLRDVNAKIFNVERRCHVQGQIVGFLGPSGIGKTQLFRIVAGLLKPTAGSVHVNSTHDEVRPGMVGVVAQNYTLFEHRTVIGNLMLAACQKEPDAKIARDKAMSFLSRFDLTECAEQYPAVLSGGQQQRVAIIQQLLCSEHFLLMDEPFSGLDVIMVEKVCELLNEVSCMDDLNTIIVVTHDVASAASVSDHLWLMGRDRDETGAIIPGARIQQEFNLVDMGLCWQKDIQARPDFAEFVRLVKGRFQTL